MKRNLLILLLLLTSAVTFAQNTGISYQAVIYAPGGEELPGINNMLSPMVDKAICLRFSILDGNQNLEYQELVRANTDSFGMVNLIIGIDSQTAGYANGFGDVSWELFDKYLRVEVDVNGYCSAFEEINYESIKYVPLAYSALNAEHVSGVVSLENGGTGAISVDGAKVNLELDRVDNTSDLEKPISNATQDALEVLQADVYQNESNTAAAILELQGNANQSEAEFNEAIDALQLDVNQNEADADSAIAALQADVDQNEMDANNAITALQADLDQNQANTDAALSGLQNELDDTQAGAGLNSDGSYSPNLQANYINSATSIVSATEILDSQVETNERRIMENASLTSEALFILEFDMNQNKADAEAAIAAVQADVDQNEADSDSAIAALQADVNQNEADADSAISTLQSDVDQNEADTDSAISALQSDVDQNEADADNAISDLQADVDLNESDADAAIAAANMRIDSLSTATTSLNSNLQDELDATQTGAGLGTDGAYSANAGSNYITTSTSIVDATEDLDAALKAVQDDVDLNESDADTGILAANTRIDSLNTANTGTFASIQDSLDLKANIASPTFTGTPKAPTPASGTYNRELATTKFVTDAINVASNDSLVNLFTDQTIAGVKTFSSDLVVGGITVGSAGSDYNAVLGYNALGSSTGGWGNVAIGR